MKKEQKSDFAIYIEGFSKKTSKYINQSETIHNIHKNANEKYLPGNENGINKRKRRPITQNARN